MSYNVQHGVSRLVQRSISVCQSWGQVRNSGVSLTRLRVASMLMAFAINLDCWIFFVSSSGKSYMNVVLVLWPLWKSYTFCDVMTKVILVAPFDSGTWIYIDGLFHWHCYFSLALPPGEITHLRMLDTIRLFYDNPRTQQPLLLHHRCQSSQSAFYVFRMTPMGDWESVGLHEWRSECMLYACVHGQAHFSGSTALSRPHVVDIIYGTCRPIKH
jgi:hypothetical protein